MTIALKPIESPAELHRDHYRIGGDSLRQFIAYARNGVLRVTFGREPAGRNRAMLCHASVSIGVNRLSEPSRLPTDDEMQAVREYFPGVDWEEDSQGGPKRVRHLWERESS